MDIQRVTAEQAKELIKKLSEEIKEYNIAYYQANLPIYQFYLFGTQS